MNDLHRHYSKIKSLEVENKNLKSQLTRLKDKIKNFESEKVTIQKLEREIKNLKSSLIKINGISMRAINNETQRLD